MMFLRRLLRNKLGIVGGAILAAFILMALLAPHIEPYPPLRPDYAARLLPPSHAHLMGTDDQGRDIWSRVIAGSQVSLPVGLVAVGIAVGGGVPLGLLAGYYPRLDAWLSRFVDVMLAFPSLLLAIGIVASMGPGLQNVMIAVGIFSIPGYVRVVRGSALAARESDYVTAAKAQGARDGAVLFRHILPNIIGPVVVLVSFGLGGAVLAASALSFLGLGAQPPSPEWGALLNNGRDFMLTAPWVIQFPGLVITVFVLAANLLGDALRDALDVRQAERFREAPAERPAESASPS
ncbi:MAG TPA: ABC transporter permease [Bacillota bacterium]|nr:ABC transporter permease [Bacillota bacterium]